MQINITKLVKNSNWQEADQLAIYMYKHDQGVELGSTKKQLQFSGQSEYLKPRPSDFKLSTLTLTTLSHCLYMYMLCCYEL